ncbi:uncharacterized protein LOC125825703 [Solanum verrucosum]|uniref:uncharacterized protein LOC125825703 n=1 Tax=Solanum verrucosum TaxID=315347 RepID=UPI0020D1B439|nr:uncharacterized protein LOC125825703 [Solanum verrucosum]
MAREPPVELFWTPDQSQQQRYDLTNKTHQQSPTNSSNILGNDSPNQEKQHTKKSVDSIEPIARIDEATTEKIVTESPERGLQIRVSFQQIRGELTSGDYSPIEEVHLTEISRKMDAHIAGDKDSSVGELLTRKFQGKGLNRIQANLVGTQLQHQLNSAGLEGNLSHNHENSNGQRQEQYAIDDQGIETQPKVHDKKIGQSPTDQQINATPKAKEVVEVESSSHFSFGVQPTDTTPSNEGRQIIPGKPIKSDYTPTTNQFREQHTASRRPQDNTSKEMGTQSGKHTNSITGHNVVILSSGVAQMQLNAKGANKQCYDCKGTRHQGHMMQECTFRIRDDEFRRKKRNGSRKKNKNKGDQVQKGKDNKQTMPKEKEEEHNQNNRESKNQKQPDQQQEDGWQVQRKKNNKQQENKVQKIVWRPTSPQNRMTKEHHQKTTQQIGISTNSNQNSYANLDMQDQQKDDREEPDRNERTPPQGAQKRYESDPNQEALVTQKVNMVNNKSTCIDSTLLVPTNSSIVYVDCNVEVEGGMEGGSQENHTNLQEGVSKGGNLTHVLHEGVHIDLSLDPKASATPKAHQYSPRQQQPHQQIQTG